MNAGGAKGGHASGTSFAQAMVDRTPRFDNQVKSRKYDITRPRKKRKKTRFY